MRLTPTSFTHGSTAVFGLAIAGYTVLRIASYAVADLPVHLGSTPPPAKAGVDDIAVMRHDVVEAGRSSHRTLPPSAHRHTATSVHTAHIGTAGYTQRNTTAAQSDDSSTVAAASDDTTSNDSAVAAQPVAASQPGWSHRRCPTTTARTTATAPTTAATTEPVRQENSSTDVSRAPAGSDSRATAPPGRRTERGTRDHGLEAGSRRRAGHRHRPGEGLLRRHSWASTWTPTPAPPNDAGGAHDAAGLGLLGRRRARRGRAGAPTSAGGQPAARRHRHRGGPGRAGDRGVEVSEVATLDPRDGGKFACFSRPGRQRLGGAGDPRPGGGAARVGRGAGQRGSGQRGSGRSTFQCRDDDGEPLRRPRAA